VFPSHRGLAFVVSALLAAALVGLTPGLAAARTIHRNAATVTRMTAADAVQGLSRPTAGHPYRHGAIPHTVATVPAALAPRASSNVIAARPGYPTKGPLYYRGGPVVTGKPHVYVVFWGSQWGTESTSGGYQVFSGDPDGLAQYVQALYTGLGSDHETWSAIATQYCQGVAVGATSCPLSTTGHVAYPSPGGVLAGVWEDTSFTPPTGPPGDPNTPGATGVTIAQEAANAAAHFGDSSIEAQYIIVSPTGTNPDGWLNPTSGYCAYHDNTKDPFWNGAVSGADVAYTNLPYAPDAGPGYCSSFANPGPLDGVGENASHEYAETLTDPYPASGWTDAQGNEVADKCDYLNANQPGAAIYLPLATGSFDFQGIWANDAGRRGGCETAQSPITVAAPAKQRSLAGTAIVPLQIPAVDAIPGAVLTYSASGLPAGLSIGASTGLVSGTPSVAGRVVVTLQATDGTFSSGAVTFDWTVKKARRT
jgi:serine protease